MKYDLIIKPEAEKEMSEIFEWYEERRKGLGYNFLLQVDAGLSTDIRNYAPSYGCLLSQA
jgi:toxin ParE1/3/4